MAETFDYDQKFHDEGAWDQGIAKDHCDAISHCEGPSMGNLNFGPDGGSTRVISVCREHCKNCIAPYMDKAFIAVDPHKLKKH